MIGVLSEMRKFSLGLLVGITTLSLTACGGSSSHIDMDGEMASYDGVYTSGNSVEGFNMKSSQKSNNARSAATEMYEEVDDVAGSGEAASANSYRENAKLIRNVSISLNTKSPELRPIFEAFSDKAIDLDGYIEDSSINNYEYSTRGDIVVRIPAGNVDTFLAYIEESDFEIVSLNDGVEDVTLEYSDITTRLEVLNTQKEKYMEYLKQANNVTEIMEIESKLQDVIYDIESTNSRLLILSSKINYSTIRITVEYSKYETTSVLGKIGKAFGESGDNIITAITDSIEFITYYLIPVLTWVFMITIALRFFLFMFKFGRKGTSKLLGTKHGKKFKELAKDLKNEIVKEEDKKDNKEVKAEDTKESN